MPLGPVIRGLFGRHERLISDLYRAIYIDITDLSRVITEWVPRASNILEVGCGEGAVSTKLRIAYPEASITSIDVSPRVGRLYQGSRDNITFRNCTIQMIEQECRGVFDLVILSDVLHHVAKELQPSLLVSIRKVVKPGGAVFIKEWERVGTCLPIYWIAYVSDRWLTGDRIKFMSNSELQEQLLTVFGKDSLVAQGVVRPWRNNAAWLIRSE